MSATAVQPDLAAAARPARPKQGWLFGPWVDLLFVANLLWPAVFLLELSGGLDMQSGVKFWQVYFVTMPHRWITLALVFLDRNRFNQRPVAFTAIALVVLALCVGVRVSTGALTCLLAVDYVWNAWHFAAQHHGIFRIYGRMSEPSRQGGLRLEKVAMRLFLCYVPVRVAGWSWSYPQLETWFLRIDYLMVLIPAVLIARELWVARREALGRIVYLVSVCAIYLALMWATHTRRANLVLMLATASALFHATEYLAVVTWAVRRGQDKNSFAGAMAYLAPRWGLSLAAFAVVLGLAGWMADQHVMQAWLLVNVVVAFLHYTYDGMIWKVRRKASYVN